MSFVQKRGTNLIKAKMKAELDGSGNVITETYTTDENFAKVVESLDSVTTSLGKVLEFLTEYYEITATSDSE